MQDRDRIPYRHQPNVPEPGPCSPPRLLARGIRLPWPRIAARSCWLAVGIASVLAGCAGDPEGSDGAGSAGGTGGSVGVGGNAVGGVVATGGTGVGTGGEIATGGSPATGGTAGTGGQPGTGGTGGQPSGGGTGGAATGGAATGGAATGGAATGGAATGGAATGGAATGGVATGGAVTGGVATGGAATGGEATGGEATGGEATGGDGSVGPLADNPLFRDFGCADPAPIVYGDTFYVLCGEDQLNADDFNMYGWRLLSSTDMSSWTDHGVLLRASDVSWIPDNRAFASQIVHRGGVFYFYASGDSQIGVLRSSSILGPWEDVNGRPLFTGADPGAPAMTIDPSVLVDDDGRVYLFYGMGSCRWAELDEDMVSIKTPAAPVAGLTQYFEAPWIMKANGTYFLIYAYGGWPSQMAYATAASPAGPWTYRGVIGGPTGTGTNHAGVGHFKERWWYAYHTEELSQGNPYARSTCVDEMMISGDTIEHIDYTSFWMD